MLLTVIKLAVPGVFTELRSGLPRLLGGSELVEIAETLGRRIAGGDLGNLISAAKYPDCVGHGRT